MTSFFRLNFRFDLFLFNFRVGFRVGLFPRDWGKRLGDDGGDFVKVVAYLSYVGSYDGDRLRLGKDVPEAFAEVNLEMATTARIVLKAFSRKRLRL